MLSRQNSTETENSSKESDIKAEDAAGFTRRRSGLGGSLFQKIMANRNSNGRKQRKWMSTVEPPRLEDLDVRTGPAALSAASAARRNSSDATGAKAKGNNDDEEADDNEEEDVEADSQEGATKQQRRSAVRRFFLDSFRPSSRSNASSLQPPNEGKRSKSPVGGLVHRLRNLAGDGRRYSGDADAGVAPARGLPHPSQIPLDSAYSAADSGETAAAASTSPSGRFLTVDSVTLADNELGRQNRYRKSSCPPGVVQERRKDLYSGLFNTKAASRQGMSDPQQPSPHQQQHLRSASSSSSKLRHSSSASGGSGGLQVRENDKYIIIGPQRDSSSVDLEEIRESSLPHPGRVFEVFSQRHRCYDLIPTSSKLLVFDHNLNVKKAFFALVYNGLRAAPVWDSTAQRFVGMLTISDFISILHHFYKSALVPMEELESHKISTWRAQLKDRLRPFLWISPEAPLFEAIRLLLHAKVHRLPVVEPQTGNALFILTHKRILKYIFLNMHQLPLPDWLDASLQQLSIGTYSGVRTVTESTPLIKVLSLFVQHRVSALPVVNAEGQLVDIYSKFDVINLAATKTYNNLDLSVKDALQYRRDRFEGVTSCRATDSLRCAIEKLVTAEVHRLVLVDDDQRVVGVISLSDILSAIVLNHETLNTLASEASVADVDGNGTPVQGDPMEMG